MNKKILKRAFALGCLTLALFCVVKKEEENKRPIIMKQMVIAEEIVADEGQDFVFDERQELVDEDESLITTETENDDYDEAAEIQGNEIQDNEIDDVESAPESVATDGQPIENEVVSIENESDLVEYDAGEELSILVVGSASTQASPDSGVIYARIESRGSDCNEAKEGAMQIFDRVVESVVSKGLAKENLRLEYFNSSSCYEFSLTRSASEYCANIGLSLEVPQLSEIQNYIDVLTENGVCCIDSINYRVADIQNQYNETLAKAIENARTKAEKLSGQQGLRLIKIKEEMSHGPALLRASANEIDFADYIGDIKIDARVVAIFEK